MILELKNLKKYFRHEHLFVRSALIKAVDDVSLTLQENSVLGLVGGSGSGKSTMAKLILKLIPQTSGKIIYGERIKNLRKDTGIIFQDPLLSLNPRMKIREIVDEPFIVNRLPIYQDKIRLLLNKLGLDEYILNRYPAQLSGGQRQKLCILRALAIQPRLLILDEPLSSLDLIMQRQILDLLISLKKEFKIAYLFISHNLAVINKIADFIAVMKDGKIVEYNSAQDLIRNPQNEYTKKLLEVAR